MREARKRNGLVVVGAVITLAVVAAIVYARQAVAGSYTAGDSMLPTIAVGAQIGVSKLDRDPVRGRVIVFRSPERPDREFVKRVVGLAGDTIATRGTEILVNGTPIARCRVGDWSYEEAGGRARRGAIWLEALDGARWLVFHDEAGASAPPAGPWTVAPGEVFVLGDNRENSHDSRFGSGGKGGGLPLDAIIGSAIGVGVPTLPKAAEALASALATCAATLSP